VDQGVINDGRSSLDDSGFLLSNDQPQASEAWLTSQVVGVSCGESHVQLWLRFTF